MSRSKLLMVISVMTILLLSIGFFIGYVSFVPIQKSRVKHRSVQRQEAEETEASEYINKTAPAIVSETLNGESWYLEDQRDKVVVVFFWSILCASCVDAVPAMNNIYLKYANDEDFLLVGVHRYPEKEFIACYCSTKDIAWPQLYEKGDSGETGFFNKMNVKRTPAICIIDREGMVKGMLWKAGAAPSSWSASRRASSKSPSDPLRPCCR